MLSTSSLAYKFDDSAPTPSSDYFVSYKWDERTPAPREPICEGQMPSSNGSFNRRVSARRSPNSSIRDAKQENQDWLAARVAREPVAEIVDKTGMTERAVHNIRQRKSKISFDNLVEYCRNDPQFAADFAEYVGLIRPGEAEMTEAVTRLVNAHARRQAT